MRHLFFFLLKHALLLICYCCILFIIVLYVISQSTANEICMLYKKSALLCSFCILTDNLMIVKHHGWLCVQRNHVHLPFILLSRLYLTVKTYHVCPFFVLFLVCDSCTTRLAPKLTHGTVGSHPVGITTAQASVWDKGTVTVALVWTLGPGQLAVKPPPAGLAVALPVHADAIVRTRGIQTIHCIKQEVHHMKGQSILIKKRKKKNPLRQKMSN